MDSRSLSILCAGAFIGMLIIVLTAWRDHHAYPIKYNCGLLMGGWHPDAPKEVVEKCRKKGYPYDSSKNRN
jgi:hypothetical protein